MSQRAPAEVAVVDHLLCDACGLCMPLCPPMAIEMRREGLLVDALVCTGCRKCIAPCPVGALRMVPNAVRAAHAAAGFASTPAAARAPGAAPGA